MEMTIKMRDELMIIIKAINELYFGNGKEVALTMLEIAGIDKRKAYMVTLSDLSETIAMLGDIEIYTKLAFSHIDDIDKIFA